jgi:hypothetical protein
LRRRGGEGTRPRRALGMRRAGGPRHADSSATHSSSAQTLRAVRCRWQERRPAILTDRVTVRNVPASGVGGRCWGPRDVPIAQALGTAPECPIPPCNLCRIKASACFSLSVLLEQPAWTPRAPCCPPLPFPERPHDPWINPILSAAFRDGGFCFLRKPPLFLDYP